MYKENQKVIVECYNATAKEIQQLTGTVLSIVSAHDREYRVNVKLDDGRELPECAPECIKFYYMRSAIVAYSNGSVIPTSINGTDQEIKEYFKIGRSFNIGSGENDLMAQVTNLEIV